MSSKIKPIDHGPVTVGNKECRILELFDLQYCILDPRTSRAVSLPSCKTADEVRAQVARENKALGGRTSRIGR